MNLHLLQQDVLGAVPGADGTEFAVRSESAERVWVSLFDEVGGQETGRVELPKVSADLFAAVLPEVRPGARYGFRADGRYDPDGGFWFDPDKLLIDPYAVTIDRRFRYDAALAAPRGQGADTAGLMPKCVVTALPPPARLAAPLLHPGGLIYEVPVRAFTMLHPDVPEDKRGTVAALAEPTVIAHLTKLGVAAVELMPVTATMDERHLPPLGLSNAWGYNPVSFMALDPRLAPGGLAELRRTVEALHAAGIGVILDLVFNHTAESDRFGPTLSLRGLDAQAYYRHALDGRLVNDTGCGNTVASDHPITQKLILDSLRHFVVHAQVDGFRFDLAPVLGRTACGFDPAAALLQAMRADPVIGSRVLIAEPWDVGPGGYQLGQFGKPFEEWNDRYRDDVRRFWRGDRGMAGALATRLAGSFDIFAGADRTRSLNFIAAHDGMTLADIVAFERKHNETNGEANRDGHNENYSWNCGIEGATEDGAVLVRRRSDLRALLATLFSSRGTIMLTAGDEWGRTQFGNNNAYAQDNADFWLYWERRDVNLERYVAGLSALRRSFAALTLTERLQDSPPQGSEASGVAWLNQDGRVLTAGEWQDPDRRGFTTLLGSSVSGKSGATARIAVCFNASWDATGFALPTTDGSAWQVVYEPFPGVTGARDGRWIVPARSVVFLAEFLS